MGDVVHCSAPDCMDDGDPNITYSRGRICKDKWSGLIHTSSLQGERPLRAGVSRLRGQHVQYPASCSRRAPSQLSGKRV